MLVDYYKLLQVQRNAKDDDLNKAARAKHKEISEAYKVLSDPRKRALYDQNLEVEEGLWRGSPPPRDSPWSGGQNGSSPDHVIDFSEFLRSGSGGSRRMYCDDKFYSGLMDGCVNVAMKLKAAAIESTLPCSLEDLYMGTTKKMKISRDVVGASGRRSTMEEVLTIEIKPGWKKGTKITFREKGNDTQQGVIPADIIFIIDEQPHSVFRRDGDDLIVTQKISLADALLGHKELTTLDGRNLRVSLDSVGDLNHEEVVKGEGMPILKEQGKKGNLIIKFKIKFPNLYL